MLIFYIIPGLMLTRCRRQRRRSPCFVWPFLSRQLRFLISLVVVVVIKRANCVGEEISIQVQYPLGLIPPFPSEVKFNIHDSKNPKSQIDRRQFALVASYAFTDHKVQGQTTENVIVA